MLRSVMAAQGLDPLTLNPMRLTSSGLMLGDRLLIASGELDAIFDSVSLARESETGRTDRLGRFDEAAVQWDTAKPWVDQKATELAEKLGASPVTTGAKFQVIIAHDVDRTTPWEPTCLLNTVLHATGLRHGSGMPIYEARSSQSIIRTIDRLLEYERNQGIGSHYFMMSGPYGLGRYSTRTDVRWRSARTTGQLIQQAGMSIGLHGSFAARDDNRYAKEKNLLEQMLGCAVTAHRNHYLRFDPLRLYAQLEQAGIRFDIGIGYVTRIGFRNGSARCHRAFDRLNERPANVFSVPQLYMDTVMQHCSPQQIVNELREALTQVKNAQGCVCLVFHPETFLMDNRAWPLFSEIIQICREMGADLSGKLPQPNAPNLKAD